MISHQQKVYAWEFVFLAANQDAVTAAEAIAIKKADAFQFISDKPGMAKAMFLMASEVSRRRSR